MKFQGNFLTLEHGSVSVGTSTEMSVHVNCLKVEPLSNDRTQYDVTDVSGKVEVAANKNDVKITQVGSLRKVPTESSSQSNTVHEGAGAGVVVLCLILCRGSGSSSVSPSQP